MPDGPQPKKTAEPERGSSEERKAEPEREESKRYDDEESDAAEQRPPADS